MIYNYLITDTLNNTIDTGALASEIQSSNITVALDEIVADNANIVVLFKANLSTAEETELDGLIAAHTGENITAPLLDVKVLEENPDPQKRTKAHFGSETLMIDCPAVIGETMKVFTFPMNISILSMEYVGIPEVVDDSFSVCVGTQTVGTITSDVSTSDTLINISPTVAQFADNGFRVQLTDGTNSDYCGRIYNVDPINLTAEMQIAPSNAYAAATPTFVQVGAFVCKDIEIDASTAPIQIGGSKIGGSFVSAGTEIVMHYHNHDGVAKRFRAILEFLY